MFIISNSRNNPLFFLQ